MIGGEWRITEEFFSGRHFFREEFFKLSDFNLIYTQQATNDWKYRMKKERYLRNQCL